MGKMKKKRKLEMERRTDPVECPFKGLPDKFIWMKINSGTKMKNVLGYALKEFGKYEHILWSGAGQSIGKVISCVELFKKKHPNLHQNNKLLYITSKKPRENSDVNHRVAEINICLSTCKLEVEKGIII